MIANEARRGHSIMEQKMYVCGSHGIWRPFVGRVGRILRARVNGVGRWGLWGLTCGICHAHGPPDITKKHVSRHHRRNLQSACMN